MNEETHQYKFMSYVNVTSSVANYVYTQFMLESVMKVATGDDQFELKVRTTPFPATKWVQDTGTFLTSMDLSKINILLTMSDVAGFWGKMATTAINSLLFPWVILNSVVMIWVIRDLTSTRKHYQQHHRQSKLAYWIARFFHDIVFYVPISYAALKMIEIFDDHLIMAPTCIVLQPLAYLPMIYLMAHCFSREITAVLTLICYTMLVQLLLP